MSKLLTVLIILGSFLFSVLDVLAIEPRISISKLPSYINNDNFKLSCSAIGGTNVQFSYKKEGGSYQDFGSVNITSNPCQIQVTGSQVNEQTKYYFKVTLDGSVFDETVAIYDVSGPSPVSGFRIDNGDNNTVIIHWRNPNNEDFSKVIIYRGETADFSADSNHEIATVLGSPDSEMTYSVNVDSLKLYYAIRAIDKAGNSSSLVGNGGSISTTATVSAKPSSGRNETVTALPKEGSVLAEETSVPEPSSLDLREKEGLVNNLRDLVSDNPKISLYLGLALVLLGIVIYFIRTKKKIR